MCLFLIFPFGGLLIKIHYAHNKYSTYKNTNKIFSNSIGFFWFMRCRLLGELRQLCEVFKRRTPLLPLQQALLSAQTSDFGGILTNL